MATADPAERTNHKRPFAAWVKRLTNLHPSSKKAKKASQIKNNPYLQSPRVPVRPSDSSRSRSRSRSSSGNASHALSRARSHERARSNAHSDSRSHSHSNSHLHSHSQSPSRRSSLSAPPVNSNRSQAPTVATNPETIHSDGGYFKVLTGTTQGGGALSSVDGAGPNSTFSSPNQSQQSLTTTLTTIQSTNANPNPNPNPNHHHASPHHHAHFSSHPASAIPSHIALAPNPQSSNAVNDNASILTLASSSKRRRRSMDTDASVRAIPPRSMWGDSRESLPLSVLSANIDHASARPSVSALTAERNSVYSSQGVSAPVIASDRNSYYAASHRQTAKERERDRDKDGHRDTGADGRSINFDAKSINYDGRSLAGTDVASLRGYEGSVRSGALGHSRNDSIPSGAPSPMVHSPLLRRPSGALTVNSEVRDGEDDETS